MGRTVLYIAFGIVALWLLGEVLLQYKARLRWRLLAFGGFLGVVTGVMLGSVVVIGVGVAAFAVGQTYVTLSFRRGFSQGWALGGRPSMSRRRRTEPGRPPAFQEPTREDSGLEYEPDAPPVPQEPPSHQPDTPVYEPEPFLDETGSYGVYGESGTADADTGVGVGAEYGYPAAAPHDLAYGYAPTADPGHTGDPAYADAPAYADPAYAAGPDYADALAYAPAHADSPAAAGAWAEAPAVTAQTSGYAPGTPDYGYDPYAGYPDQQYAYDNGQQYTVTSADPYAAGPAAPGMDGAGAIGDLQGYAAQPPGQYAPYDGGQQGYGHPPEDPYATSYSTPTPPGGVWMPQQRATESPYGDPLMPEQPYPYPDQGQSHDHSRGQNGGYDATGTGSEYGPNDQQYRY
jgi:hypothetical protein